MSDASDADVDLLRFVDFLWESRTVVLVVTIVFALASIVFSLAATPIYRADVVVVPADDNAASASSALAGRFGGLVGVNFGQASQGQEAQGILQSRKLVEDFVVQQGVLDELSGRQDEEMSLWRVVKDFREQVITIREDPNAGLTTVSVNWTDPNVAAQWANGFINLANDTIRNRDLAEATKNIEYLTEQIEQTNVVALQAAMYNLVEAETKTVMLANGREEYAFAVVDPAVPPEIRAKPRRKLIVIAGTAFGAFMGILIAFGLSLVASVQARTHSTK